MAELDTGEQNEGMIDHARGTTGQLLAAAREAAGLDLAAIARDTRVPIRHLKAIETDAHDTLPALPYAMGFVKSYARAVGLNAEDMAARFRGEARIAPPAATVTEYEPADERRVPSRGLVVFSIVAIIAVLAGIAMWGKGVFDAAPASAPAEVAAAPAAPSPNVPPPSGPAPVEPAINTVVPAAAPVPAGGAVVLTAKEDVWIKVSERLTRRTVYMGILTPGQSWTVPADTPDVVLRTGKAGALAITVGGRAIAPLGGPVETVSNVSLTAESLAARGAPAAAAPVPVNPAASGPATP